MGIVLVPLGVVVGGLYLWIVVKGTRWTYRNFEAKGAIAAIVFFVLLPTWDALINQYYFKEVLCKRPDVGLQIYRKIVLPTEMYDDKGNPKLPDSMNDPKHPFLGKYIFDIHYKDEGSYPVTANRHLFQGAYDISTGQFVSKFEDYQPTGGWLWTRIFRPVLNTSDYDWIMSRGSKQSCFERDQFWKMLSEAKAKPFTLK